MGAGGGGAGGGPSSSSFGAGDSISNSFPTFDASGNQIDPMTGAPIGGGGGFDTSGGNAFSSSQGNFSGTFGNAPPGGAQGQGSVTDPQNIVNPPQTQQQPNPQTGAGGQQSAAQESWAQQAAKALGLGQSSPLTDLARQAPAAPGQAQAAGWIAPQQGTPLPAQDPRSPEQMGHDALQETYRNNINVPMQRPGEPPRAPTIDEMRSGATPMSAAQGGPGTAPAAPSPPPAPPQIQAEAPTAENAAPKSVQTIPMPSIASPPASPVAAESATAPGQALAQSETQALSSLEPMAQPEPPAQPPPYSTPSPQPAAQPSPPARQAADVPAAPAGGKQAAPSERPWEGGPGTPKNLQQGQVVGDWKYEGGNPNDPNNWSWANPNKQAPDFATQSPQSGPDSGNQRGQRPGGLAGLAHDLQTGNVPELFTRLAPLAAMALMMGLGGRGRGGHGGRGFNWTTGRGWGPHRGYGTFAGQRYPGGGQMSLQQMLPMLMGALGGQQGQQGGQQGANQPGGGALPKTTEPDQTETGAYTPGPATIPGSAAIPQPGSFTGTAGETPPSPRVAALGGDLTQLRPQGAAAPAAASGTPSDLSPGSIANAPTITGRGEFANVAPSSAPINVLNATPIAQQQTGTEHTPGAAAASTGPRNDPEVPANTRTWSANFQPGTSNPPQTNADPSNYLGQNGGHSTINGQSVAPGRGLNPQFAQRLIAAGQAYQAETGQKPTYGEGYRDDKQQQRYWAARGNRYDPSNPAARPISAGGRGSRHEYGMAMDMPSGAFSKWLHTNGKRFGLGFPVPNDSNHIQMQDLHGRNYPVQQTRNNTLNQIANRQVASAAGGSASARQPQPNIRARHVPSSNDINIRTNAPSGPEDESGKPVWPYPPGHPEQARNWIT